MQGFKYGLLVLPSREGLSAPLRMDDSTELVPTTLDALIDKKQTKHWREWVGSIEWKQLTEADALVITRIPSDTPEVMDGGSQKLQGRAVTSWFAYLLAERSEEHTSELQSPDHLVCRLLLEKKKQI